MPFKISWQWWHDEDGKLVLGDSSFVPCAEDDLYRLRTVEEFDRGSPVKHVQPKDTRK